ncbi:hypothetical protein OH76DRAFT_118564 [Lentinus brumalis]|uniref:Uncharacterized protein n=1 Tax=Lentinus brumalis TaxID=2498619 RepID=A0A371DJI6_9APHY|nr:hypothetical protein OH76DRAFT_118564 [Polyporus brumalis]
MLWFARYYKGRATSTVRMRLRSPSLMYLRVLAVCCSCICVCTNLGKKCTGSVYRRQRSHLPVCYICI